MSFLEDKALDYLILLEVALTGLHGAVSFDQLLLLRQGLLRAASLVLG